MSAHVASHSPHPDQESHRDDPGRLLQSIAELAGYSSPDGTDQTGIYGSCHETASKNRLLCPSTASSQVGHSEHCAPAAHSNKAGPAGQIDTDKNTRMSPAAALTSAMLPKKAHMAQMHTHFEDTPANKSDEMMTQRAREQIMMKHFSSSSTRRPSPSRSAGSLSHSLVLSTTLSRAAACQNSIHAASKYGDTVFLSMHVETPGQLELLDQHGMQALHIAASYGQTEAIE